MEFVLNPTKKNLLTNCTKLKGTKISIAAQQRGELAVLKRHLNANRQYQDRTSFIRKNKLIIDVKQLLEAGKEETGEQFERRSLPSTPTQPLIREAFEDGITKQIQETTNIPITPKPSGSSGAINKQPPKPFNQNIEEVKTRSNNERRK
ncbi:hypothetical protein JTB14_024070 [Gonioctena quinquepunctata]|nr:hypothetical protein JTB14_024070 [Gonioctena quinquepunctata]